MQNAGSQATYPVPEGEDEDRTVGTEHTAQEEATIPPNVCSLAGLQAETSDGHNDNTEEGMDIVCQHSGMPQKMIFMHVSPLSVSIVSNLELVRSELEPHL